MENQSVTIAANRIIDAIENDNCYHLLIAGDNQCIFFYKKDILHLMCLRSGQAEIRRISDNTVIDYIKSPAILGLMLHKETKSLHYIKTTCSSELLMVNHEKGMNLINEKNLWKEAFLLTINMINTCYMRDENFISRNVYGIVRQHLELIWKMEPDIRETFSIFDFILNRTTISRSSLNKILKDLSAGGYIKTRRGVLLEKRTLPLKY
ncbi:helix-turn-helix domain-containing protein [Enterobacter kobei]|uniref:helix-turn-helix domain-containing protein n=1 Tax=Enterobacter kobei TaxID=208224 RepID=UPI000680EB13|nr:helix-turn-helix domain-containing protein [Enterobacter kobei]